MKDPYISRSTREERNAEAKRTRQVRWLIAGVVAVIVVVIGGSFYLVYSGDSVKPLSPDKVDELSLNGIDSLIEDGNAILSDPKATAAAKAKWLKDRALLEKQRADLLAKHPEWGKK